MLVSKMKEVAELLGLSLGQFFKLEECAQDEIFWLDENGLNSISLEDKDVDDFDNSFLLVKLITGDSKITCVAEWKSTIAKN